MLVRLFAPVVVAASMFFASSVDAGFFHRNAGCCDAAPSCGCEVAAPSCGGCGAPSCGCEVAVDPCCGGRKFGHHLHALIGRLHARNSCCAPACEPTCAPACAPAPVCAPACAPAPVCAPACEPSCGCEVDSCCGHRHHLGGLLRAIKARCAAKSACCAPACDSCGAAAPSCGCGM